jgi:hypothetical protein
LIAISLESAENVELRQRLSGTSRQETLRIVLGGVADQDILAQSEQAVAILADPQQVNASVCYHLARTLLRRAPINLRQAAIATAAAHRIHSRYDLLQARFFPADFVELFPATVSDQEIRDLAGSVGWLLSEHEWAFAYWGGELRRTQTSGHRQPPAFWGDIPTVGNTKR